MPLRVIQGNPDAVIREEYVGSTTTRICYPGISSCLTITGVSPNGLIGTHITIATEPELVAALFQTLKTGGASSCQHFYVIGAISRFKPNTRSAELNTRKKISNKIKAAFNKGATVRFYDSTAHQEIHVLVEKNGVQTNFFRVTTQNQLVQGFTYPDFNDKIQISANQFVVR